MSSSRVETGAPTKENGVEPEAARSVQGSDELLDLVKSEFSAAYYLSANPDIAAQAEGAEFDPLKHFLEVGWKEGRNPNPNFWTDGYLKRNKDVASSGMNPFVHYVAFGRDEGRKALPVAEDGEGFEKVRKAVQDEFSKDYYLANNPDIADVLSDVDPFQHFLTVGWKEGRDPNPDFSVKHYLEENSDVEAAGINPLYHYVVAGRAEGRLPHPDALREKETSDTALVRDEFSPDYYRMANPDIAHEMERAGLDPMTHFLTVGWREGRDPNPSFSTNYYLAVNRDVAAADVNPFVHYLRAGRAEGRRPRPSVIAPGANPDVAAVIRHGFSPSFYASANPDVNPEAAADFDYLSHYVEKGWKEDRDPNPNFSTAYYQNANPDVAAADVEPFYHFLTTGREEGRSPHPAVPPVQHLNVVSRAPKARSPGQRPRRRIVVYTAIVNAYDQLKFPEVVSTHLDYIVLTNQPIGETGPWKVRGIDYYNDDSTRIARYVKTHPHVYVPEYEVSIWVDANLLILDDISSLATRKSSPPWISAFRHPHRGCVYEEAEEVKRRGLDAPAIIDAQIARYRDEGFPANRSLTETNVLVRENLPELRRFNELWWNEIAAGSRRDQLSFDYVAWKTGIERFELAPRGTSVRNSSLFKRYRHKSLYFPQSDTARSAARAVPQDSEIRYDYLTEFDDRRFATSHLHADIVVCVHNALDDVRRCLEAVENHRRPIDRVIVVDDGSQRETADFLKESFANRPHDILIRQEEPQGYTKAANAGLLASDADYVVLLNSDTIVPHAWVEKLIEAGERSPVAGLIGPLSNAASWQSIPDVLDPVTKDLAVNALPDDMSIADMNSLCEVWSGKVYPPVQLLNGFCMAIKREVLDRVGYLDEVSFPDGYGEENDFVFRAADAGFMAVVATNLYVFHTKSKSYTHDRRKTLSVSGSAAFRAKYSASRVNNAILSTRDHPELIRLRLAAKKAMEQPDKMQAARGPRPAYPMVTGSTSQEMPTLERSIQAFELTAEALEANRRLLEAFKANPTLRPDRLLWFVPDFEHVHRGGLRTIFRTADHFNRVHGTRNIFVVYDCASTPEALRKRISDAFPHLTFSLITRSESEPIDTNALPYCDAAICTLWNSAYHLLHYNNCRAKFYFIQDFEPAFYEAGTRYGLIEETYRFGFLGIANTPGVAEMYRQYTDWAGYFVPGIDHALFHPGPDRVAGTGPFRLVFYGRPANARNAFTLGTEALKRVKSALGDGVEILTAGADFDPGTYGLSGVLINLGVLKTMEDVAALYRSCDAGLVFMFTMHPSYQPLEYMASGCVTVTNTNHHTRWLLEDGVNAILSEANSRRIADRIVELASEEALRARIVEGGLRTAHGLSWDAAMARISEFVTSPRPARGSFVDQYEEQAGGRGVVSRVAPFRARSA